MSSNHLSQNAAVLERHRAIAQGLRPLPSLYTRSITLLLMLYGALGFLLVLAAEAGFLSAAQALITGVAIAALQFLVSPWVMDLSLRFLYRITWVEKNELPQHLLTFVEKVCSEQAVKFPSFGIIPDGAPEAFTYGHHPGNARIVLSRGMFELLTAPELEAVVAHELGHICHWDMVVMTVAQLVPLLAYYIYRTATDMASERDKQRGVASLVALGAYIVYGLSQLAVLWFSRIREFYADRFAGEKTKDPNSLASGLVKIGYGLAAGGAAGPGAASVGSPSSAPKMAAASGFGAMNIFDRKSALNLVVSTNSGATSGSFDPEILKGALQWDLWNPWATFFELQSTHPLIAKRLEHLGDQSVFLGQEPLVVFDRKKPESYWDEFVVDLIVTCLPVVGFLLGIVMLAALASTSSFNPKLFGLVVFMTGVGVIVKTRMSYRSGQFPQKSVADLLQEIKVSPVRPVAVTLTGKVIGKGVPGLIWSEDFVVQDDSGIIFLDYRQPLKIWEWFFGILKAGSFQGQTVTVRGWFRRAPIPFIEIGSIKTHADGRERTCYVRTVKLAFGVLLVAIGILILI